MASTQRELEEQLAKAGERLLEPPSSDDELLSLLDQIEGNLSTVEQSPSKSMQTALKPCLKGLVENKLLKHPNVDVKVSVATCISEITRITAPDAPYDDEKMKEIFELIVLSFEDLADKSSRSYSKRTLILDTVAKVRSCVVMLDLECDGLIVKMFQHFLKSIRDYHPEGVFTSMETIMTLVLEESEDISIELISPILSALKKDNKDFSSVAQKLGERVFGNCAKKLKNCLNDAKKSLGISLDEYSDIVASISDDAVRENNGETCEEHEVEESKLPKSSSELVVQAGDEKQSEASLEDANKEHMAQESAREASPGREVPVVDGSGTSVLSNGISESKIELKLDNDTEASQKLDGEEQGDKSSDGKGKSNEADDLESGKIVSSEHKTDQTSKKRGRKAKSSTKSAEPSDSSRVDDDKEAERLAESTTATEETHNSPKDLSHEATLSSENEKVVKLSPPEVLENEPVNAAPLSPSGSVPDEGRPKRANAGRSKKKEKLLQEASLPTDVSEKPSEGANDSEAKPPKRSAKKVPTGKASQEKTSALVDTSKGKGVTSGDSEAKLPEQSDKKIDSKDNNGSEPSSKKVDKRKRGRGKATSEKPIESSAKDDDKEALSSPTPDLMDEDVAEETPKVTSKRKRGPGKDDAKETPKSLLKSSKGEDHTEETPKTSSKSNSSQGKKASDNIEYGKNLVGSNIQVWWPDDEMFYKGVITAYHPKKKQHTVLYTDEEVETLNLKDEIWEFIEPDSLSDKEQVTGDRSPKSGDPSLEKPKKKKAKTDSQTTPKQGKGAEEVAPSRSKKSSGRETKDEKKVDEKLKDKSSKSASKSEDGNSVKAKDKSKKSGGKSGESSKSAGKSKDVDSSSTPKMSSTKPSTAEGSAKSATKDTPEASAATKSKGKSPKTPGLNKTDTIGGSDKEKSVSGKTKEVEGSKKTSSEKAKTPVSGSKKKSSPEETPKSQPSETKSGKKRGRGSRH